ncbi:biotin synthase [bacterium BMS3Abin01]|nr:biotin synthase [bacterium BMS3Abin01]HDY69840.1 radical SAM protein [Actinomycetota bacterium]
MTEGANRTSPDYVRLSLAAAITLSLRSGLFYRGARLHCLNLLLTYEGGCRARCAYCGLSAGNGGGPGSFIRVEWPVFSVDEVLSRVRSSSHGLERICISMVMHPQALSHTLELTRRLNRDPGLPVSILVNPSTIREGDLEALREAGADMATVAVDTATEALFTRYRGREAGGPHRWDRYWRTLEEAAIVFGRDRFGCHLIAGLGESEKEMIDTIQRVRSLGGRSHMFAFYPEPGSNLAEAEACPPSRFRRMQLARFLIDYGLAGSGGMEYDEQDRLVCFGLEASALDDLVESGRPFLTSGCPGATHECACNRPFGDGPPDDIRSYPFQLEAGDIELVKKQLAIYNELPPVLKEPGSESFSGG